MPKKAKPASRAPTKRWTIVAQDPGVTVDGFILTAEIEVPAEELAPGPCGYRVNVIDYDATANTLYEVWKPSQTQVANLIPPKRASGAARKRHNERLLSDPRFHAQNTYAIVMRTLAKFEAALGRRVSWGSQGHQLHVAPHAFAEANAYYSREDRSLFFGYFTGAKGRPVFTALSHDVVVHETTHALLDGLRTRYLEPSSPDQAAFHEGFADVVALLSVFSLPPVVSALLDSGKKDAELVDEARLTRAALTDSVLFGLAEQMGSEVSGCRGQALRRSVKLKPGLAYRSMAEFEQPHVRGELLVAAMMNAMLDIWLARLTKIGTLGPGQKDRSLVVEQGATVASHLLTMAIRALDYCPPTDITFSDYLSALLTIDREVVPDDSKYGYRAALLKNFQTFDIAPSEKAGPDGAWVQRRLNVTYARSRFESMLRDKEEVFRFLWENRSVLKLHEDGYIQVESVRPSVRLGPEGFVLRETVAEYVQILTLEARELKAALGIKPPAGMPDWERVRIYGGGAAIFDEYGQLKYHIGNRLEDRARQTERLRYLWESGAFDRSQKAGGAFAALHLARATQ